MISRSGAESISETLTSPSTELNAALPPCRRPVEPAYSRRSTGRVLETEIELSNVVWGQELAEISRSEAEHLRDPHLTINGTKRRSATSVEPRIAADVALSTIFDFIEKCNGSLGHPPMNDAKTQRFSQQSTGENG